MERRYDVDTDAGGPRLVFRIDCAIKEVVFED